MTAVRGWRMWRMLAALALLAAALPVRAEPLLRVTDLELRPVGDGVGLLAQMSGDPIFSLFTLTRPYRVVVDLPPFAWEAGDPDPAEGIVAIRRGAFRHDSGRIVIELDRPMRVSRAAVVPRRGGFALEIRMEPTTPRRFAETAGWPEGARWAPEPRARGAAEGSVIVAIDPGHGGLDPGALAGDLVEKDLVLDFAKDLAARVSEIEGLHPVLTREDDRFVPLRGRIQLAREAKAHVFLSIHADSLESGVADGASVYTLDREGTDSAADAFAERENRADVLAGVNLSGSEDDVTRLLIELARRGSKAESIKLAEAITAELGKRVDLLDTRPHRRGNFFVLKAPDIPSVLIELGFLSSEIDRQRLTDPAWRAAMTEGIARGVATWVDIASPGFRAPRG